MADFGETGPARPRLYLDANASERLRPEARAAMLAALDRPGNPASQHKEGRQARQALEQARAAIATRFGGAPADLVFTSGGTEANALAVAGLAPGRRVLVGSTEHPAIREAAPDTTPLPVHQDGTIDLAALAHHLTAGPPALVCLMHANNETGVLHPIAAAAALCHAHGALLHVDAVQSAGRLPVSLAGLGADSLAISSHKLGGPAGAGALLLRPGLPLAAAMPGGGQERGRRGGTPALAAIAGFAAACICPPNPAAAALRDRIETHAARHGAIVVGAPAPRLPNTTCLARPGRPAHTQVIALDLAGIAVSAGAACSSGRIAASQVLIAMGLAPLAGAAIRVSLGWHATDTDADAFEHAYR